MLGRYRLDAVIGRGGMGVVFRAVDERLDRTVAIKVLAADLVGDPLVQQRFLREARVAAAIEHPHIVPVYEAASAGDVDYIAMRYVPGPDLGRVLRREAPLDATRTLGIVEQIAGALDAAHARGLVHRDVKPSNVLLEDRGGEWAWLSDFGLTKRMDGSVQLTRDGLVGTLEYIAPEVIERGHVDGRSDQYALACVAYHCLSGKPPFVARSEAQLLHAHLHDIAPPLAGPEAEPSAVDAVIRRALAKQPAERFPSCRAFTADLGRAIEEARDAAAAVATAERATASESLTGSTRAAPAPARSVAVGRTGRVLGAVALAGTVVGSMYLVGQPPQTPGGLALLPSGTASVSYGPTTSPTHAVLAATAVPTVAVVPTLTPARASLAPSEEPTPRATPFANILTGPDGVLVFAGDLDGDFDIWAIRPDMTGLTQITSGPARETSPSVSADGTRIVYVVGTQGDRELYLLDTNDGMRPQRLTRDDHDDFAPAISPDGKQIAWVSDRSGFKHIWLMTDRGDGFVGRERRATDLTNQRLTAGNHSQEPAWFPDGVRLAFQSNDLDSPDIWSIDVGDRLSRTPWTADRIQDFQPTVGRGDTIVFVRAFGLGRRFLYRVEAPPPGVYRWPPRGRKPPTRVSKLPNPRDPDFSPDLRRLVVVQNDELVTMSANGTGQQRVPVDGMGTVKDPDWVEKVAVPRRPR
jgi:serine/threonine-protein kinase